MKRFASSVALSISMLAFSGCSSGGPVPIYDTCFDVNDCVLAADACAFMSYQFGSLVFESAICTVQCFDDFDCPLSFNGEPGGCYPEAIADGFPGCVERCFDDLDCPAGFTCAFSDELLFLDPGDSICVPGPS